MKARLEQPKYLNEVYAELHRVPRKVRILIYLWLGLFVGVLVVASLWAKTALGQHFSLLRWMLAPFSGFFMAAFFHALFHILIRRRRSVQLGPRAIYLRPDGPRVALKRVREMTIAPVPDMPDYYLFKITYAVMLQEKLFTWSMLIDDLAAAADFQQLIAEWKDNTQKPER